MTAHILVPAEMQADEYGTIWIGEPGAHGSTVVGDLLWDEDYPEVARIVLQPEEDWKTVQHRDDGTTSLGGQEVTDDELEGAGRRVIITEGSVPSWMKKAEYAETSEFGFRRLDDDYTYFEMADQE